jgi:hypothetical protein
MAAVVEKYLLGTTTQLLSTELNSLASNAAAAVISSVGGTSGVFDNTAGGGGFDGYPLARFELVLAAPAGALTAGTAVLIWFISQVDATNYEDGGSAVIPARTPDLVIPVRAVSTAQRITRLGSLPPNTWKVLLSQATGQTWNAAGNTLKVSPVTKQGV